MPDTVRRFVLQRNVNNALTKPSSDATEAVMGLINDGKTLFSPERLKKTASPLLRQEFAKIVTTGTNGLLNQMGEKPIPSTASLGHSLHHETFQKFLAWAVGEDAESEQVFLSLLSRFKIARVSR